MADRDLLKRALKFEEQALAEIYDRWSPALYRYAMRLLGEANLAEECVSDTFHRFLVALQQGNGPQDYLQAYLYRIAHNWISDHYRRHAPIMVPLDPEINADGDQEPHEVSVREFERQQIRDALRALTPDQRQVILLKYVEDLDNEAIAAALNKPVGSIKSLQHRALESLRKILDLQKSTDDEKK